MSNLALLMTFYLALLATLDEFRPAVYAVAKLSLLCPIVEFAYLTYKGHAANMSMFWVQLFIFGGLLTSILFLGEVFDYLFFNRKKK